VPDFTFDLGGLTGGVLGAIAAAFGVVYSLRKTDTQNRHERDEKIARLRAAIVIEARLIGIDLYNLNFVSVLKPDNFTPREFYRTQQSIAVASPSLMREALGDLSSLPRKEAERILFLLNGDRRLQGALDRARSAPTDEEFQTAIATVHQAFMFQCGQVGLLLEQMSPSEVLPLTPPRRLTELLREISAWPIWWTIRYPDDASAAPTQPTGDGHKS
jgi:hypothetical protein